VSEKKTIAERVIEAVASQFGIDKDEIGLDSRFIDDIGADSLDVTELVMEFEEEFDIKISDEVSDKLKTVGQVVEYVESLPQVAD
jgi:acyl carrier protein